ncbi:ion transporter [Myxococcota bacterium]|nr:ion transporter [Myxococcota bacterium]
MKRPPLRYRIRRIMEPYNAEPDQTKLSLWVDLFILFSIVSSCLLIPFEHLYSTDTHPFLHKVLWVGEVFFSLVFTIEYGLRWFGSKNRIAFPFTPYALIDLAAFLPTLLLLIYGLWAGQGFFLLRAFRGAQLLRTLRILRLLRILKFLRHGYAMYRLAVELRIWSGAIIYHYRLGRLARLLVMTLIAWVLGANIVHLTERMFGGDAGTYADYWRSYWEIIVVLISGMDASRPVTLLGSIEIVVLLFVGIVLVGMLTGEIVGVVMRSMDRHGRVPLKPPGLVLEQHILILGWNGHLDNVIRQIRAALHGHHYILIVSPDADQIPIINPEVYRRVLVLVGEPTQGEVLDEMSIPRALRAIILSGDRYGAAQDRDNHTLMQAVAITARRKDIPLTLELEDRESLRYARALRGAECIVSQPYGELMLCQAVLNPGVTEVYDELLTFTDDSSEIYAAPCPEALVGLSYAQAQLYFLDADEEALVLLGIDRSPADEVYTRFYLHPTTSAGFSEEELKLKAEDRLIFIAYQRPSFAKPDEEDLWSGRILVRP